MSDLQRANRNEAVEKRAADLLGALDELMTTLTEETELVRAGRVREAARLTPIKTKVAQSYIAAAEALKSNAAALGAPATREALHQRQEQLRALLQTNLTVLATAHAVSESVIRGAAAEVARKNAPRTYGVSGRPVTNVKFVAPVAVSRVL
jgi:hypothetical protein